MLLRTVWQQQLLQATLQFQGGFHCSAKGGLAGAFWRANIRQVFGDSACAKIRRAEFGSTKRCDGLTPTHPPPKPPPLSAQWHAPGRLQPALHLQLPLGRAPKCPVREGHT